MRLRGSSVVLGAVFFAIVATAACGGDEGNGDSVASSSSQIESGREAYEASCAVCHGKDLKGTRTGPPFLDVVYAPNHHPDASFRAAVARGVQPHHWSFGPMPPQPQVSDDEIEEIIAYVRAQQLEAGITNDPSH